MMWLCHSFHLFVSSVFFWFRFVYSFGVQRQLYCHIKQYKVGTLAVDGRAVTFGTPMGGLGGAPARTVPSSLYQT